jgi:uridylate kinase
MAYSRVLLKISGEAFCKEGGRGIDIKEVRYIAREVVEASKIAQIAVVVGGGNIVRGREICREDGIHEATADYMGMVATLINSLALQDVLESMGATTRLVSALAVQALAEPFIRRRVIRHLEKGRIVILASGTGNPHFTTDTAASLKAAEIKAQVLLKATKVDGVYDSDPMKNKSAQRYVTLSYLDVINKGLSIMDVTAISMSMELKLPVIVFNLKQKGNIKKVISGAEIGTTISNKSSVLTSA